jgi:signal transduction histidine kinase
MDKAFQESAITFYDKTILGDLRDICQAALGDTIGDFDGPRLAQVFSNLLNNAAQYRSDAQPVVIDPQGSKKEWIVTVTNFGSEISVESQRAIFDLLVQLPVSSDQKGPATTSLGPGPVHRALNHGGARRHHRRCIERQNRHRVHRAAAQGTRPGGAQGASIRRRPGTRPS